MGWALNGSPHVRTHGSEGRSVGQGQQRTWTHGWRAGRIQNQCASFLRARRPLAAAVGEDSSVRRLEAGDDALARRELALVPAFFVRLIALANPPFP
jgi:hypothetical protein